MARRPGMNLEEEIQKTIERNDDISIYFERMKQLLNNAEKELKSFHNGNDLPGRKIRVLLSKMQTCSQDTRMIVQAIRKYRKDKKRS